MPIESLPKFIPKPAELWSNIPADVKKRLLSNV